MTVSPMQFQFNFNLPALGYVEYDTSTYSVGARTVASGSYYTSPVQTISFDNNSNLSNIMVQLSGLDNLWRPLYDWGGWVFDNSNNFYHYNRFGTITNGNTAFSVNIVWFIQDNQLKYVVYLINEKNVAVSVNVPDFTINWRVYLFRPPT